MRRNVWQGACVIGLVSPVLPMAWESAREQSPLHKLQTCHKSLQQPREGPVEGPHNGAALLLQFGLTSLLRLRGGLQETCGFDSGVQSQLYSVPRKSAQA